MGANKMEEVLITWYVVRCCGCTDCFPRAAFINREDALEWAEVNCPNPEGYVIEEVTALDAVSHH